MNHAEQRLLSVCDDLLTLITKARTDLIIGKPDATPLIDRILDVRNTISPPKPQPKTKS